MSDLEIVPDEAPVEASDLHVDESVATSVTADDALAQDVRRKQAYDAIDKIVEQRNTAEAQARYLIRDLWQIAGALLCEPTQSGVMNAITGLQDKVRELEGENEDAYAQIDYLNDWVKLANDTLEVYIRGPATDPYEGEF